MPKKSSTVKRLPATAPKREGHCIGLIARIDDDGSAWVTFPDTPDQPPLRARSTLDAPASPLAAADAMVGAEVLVVFANGDPRQPIVTGVIRSRLQPPAAAVPTVALDKNTVRDVLVDGRQLVFNAQQQILLRCGKSSVLLRKDGKIILRGADLLSRSSGPNKIKGASIDLN